MHTHCEGKRKRPSLPSLFRSPLFSPQTRRLGGVQPRESREASIELSMRVGVCGARSQGEGFQQTVRILVKSFKIDILTFLGSFYAYLFEDSPKISEIF